MVDEICENCNWLTPHYCGAHGECSEQGLVDVDDSCWQFLLKDKLQKKEL